MLLNQRMLAIRETMNYHGWQYQHLNQLPMKDRREIKQKAIVTFLIPP